MNSVMLATKGKPVEARVATFSRGSDDALLREEDAVLERLRRGLLGIHTEEGFLGLVDEWEQDRDGIWEMELRVVASSEYEPFLDHMVHFAVGFLQGNGFDGDEAWELNDIY